MRSIRVGKVYSKNRLFSELNTVESHYNTVEKVALELAMLGMGFPFSSVGKESACNAGEPSSIPRLGRSAGEGIAYPPTPGFLGFPGGLAGKESACNAGDLSLIPGLGRSPGEGKGYPFQHSGLENAGYESDVCDSIVLRV